MHLFSNFIFDLDGVIYRGKTPIKGAQGALASLAEKRAGIYFLTNNATKTRTQYVKKLAGMGIRTSKKHVYTAAYGAAKYLSDEGFRKIHVVGEKGLRREISGFGLKVSPSHDCDAVVAALDTKFNYKKMGMAANAIRGGAFFIAANLDPTNPIEDGFLPGSGAIVESISAAAEKRPDIVIGKPHTYLLDDILLEHKIEKNDVALVGDRLDTDVLVANKKGIYSICVLTGSTSKFAARNARGLYKPKKIVKSVADVLQFAK